MALAVGIDTGGTFTDMVVFDPETGRIDSLKTSSTPSSPGQAIVNALAEGGVPADELERFTHGTTVGTNALIERTGCKVAFVTTKGFEDTPYIQRINRKVLYDLRWRKPEPLVASRRLCLGLDERLDAAGATLRAVDEQEVRALCREIRDEGAEAVALSLLFSYVSTEHEETVKQIFEEELPGMPVSVSHEVAPIWREYERSSTTIADAYLRPLVGRYVEQSQHRVARRRHDARMDADEVERRRHAVRRRGEAPDPDRHVRPSRGHDGDRAHRAARSASPTSSRSTWAARAPMSAFSSTESSATRPNTRSSGVCPRPSR